MAKLHSKFINFNDRISLNIEYRKSLEISSNALRQKIADYFKIEKPNELQPTFAWQGSFPMNTIVNPIPQKNQSGKEILKYDLDDGIYFHGRLGGNKNKDISILYDWVYNAVENHTSIPTKRKSPCISVIFADGHNIDLPIYYRDGQNLYFGHRSKGWIESNPLEFIKWFEENSNEQLVRIIRYLKAWKDFQKQQHSHIKFPSGFIWTVLAVKHHHPNDAEDIAFLGTIENIQKALKDFRCLRPTTPKGENLLTDYNRNDASIFLGAFNELVQSCQKAEREPNFKTACNQLIHQFGNRFPEGKNETAQEKSNRTKQGIGTMLAPKPYASL